MSFENGKKAYLKGKQQSDNPFICGQTKLGNPKFSEGGEDWLAGYISAMPARVASKKEMEAAAQLDVSRFRRKANRYYK